jgi:hypothetical protein
VPTLPTFLTAMLRGLHSLANFPLPALHCLAKILWPALHCPFCQPAANLFPVQLNLFTKLCQSGLFLMEKVAPFGPAFLGEYFALLQVRKYGLSEIKSQGINGPVLLGFTHLLTTY